MRRFKEDSHLRDLDPPRSRTTYSPPAPIARAKSAPP